MNKIISISSYKLFVQCKFICYTSLLGVSLYFLEYVIDSNLYGTLIYHFIKPKQQRYSHFERFD
jgi:hypothetical protein